MSDDNFVPLTANEVQEADLIIVPVGDRVVIKPIEAERTIAGGLLLPEGAEENSQMGYVVAAGSGHLRESGVYNLEVEDGEIVLYSKYAGAKVSYRGEDFIVLREEDIFARLLNREYINQLYGLGTDEDDQEGDSTSDSS